MQKSRNQRSAEYKMRKRGRIEIEVFIVLITIVFTSAVILLLVYSGAIKVKEDAAAEPVLNAEFLPVGKEGFLAVKQFDFCSEIDENLYCLETKEEFGKTENMYVRFVVENTVFDHGVILWRNYEIRNPLGEVVLQAEQKNAYNFELSSTKKTENIVFADYFVMGDDAIPGEYILDVIIENPLLEKKITLTKKFTVIEGEVFG